MLDEFMVKVCCLQYALFMRELLLAATRYEKNSRSFFVFLYSITWPILVSLLKVIINSVSYVCNISNRVLDVKLSMVLIIDMNFYPSVVRDCVKVSSDAEKILGWKVRA